MKRVIIDIPDEYAGAVSVTAIGVGQVGMRSETHIKTTVVVLEGECTEINWKAMEKRRGGNPSSSFFIADRLKYTF